MHARNPNSWEVEAEAPEGQGDCWLNIALEDSLGYRRLCFKGKNLLHPKRGLNSISCMVLVLSNMSKCLDYEILDAFYQVPSADVMFYGETIIQWHINIAHTGLTY